MNIKEGILRIITDNCFSKKLPVGSYIRVTESKYDETTNSYIFYVESLDGTFKKWVLDVVLVWYTKRLDGGV
jgi:hypothetical protein